MRKVIYTVIVGGYDDVRSLPPFPGWDFVLLTDKKPSLWKRLLRRSRWQVRLFDNPGLDLTRYSRLPKLKPHLFFPDYDYSVYIDGNARFERDPSELLEALGWPSFAVSEHPFRSNLYDEFSECSRMGYDAPDVFERQEEKYRAEGLSDPAPLYENNLILRRHNEAKVMELGDLWFDELGKESKRDQLSLPYVCWCKGFSPSAFPQSMKRQYFRTRSHHRSFWTRIGKSMRKRFQRMRQPRYLSFEK
ncbi:MAG: hypothetical protein CMO07_07335 [Thalassospira sp.]|uniref:glycosyltransferase domain-containing protein n=1 Tax=unclassified Thalassospira TaxID=2648997 RepID=UPI000C37A288|nr:MULTISPECIES: glycosyltransferase domain-containing protein [unclassified Thalassospira]MBE70546.1 hypothetical protein [Thalassospira sp.]QPO11224.1 DUF616 domain-containing protein [Thalassospira sp. A40-3]|tara:strand:- start:99 stop:839 length:741 start_codon:yes stop_codon:yes gene_type:complete